MATFVPPGGRGATKDISIKFIIPDEKASALGEEPLSSRAHKILVAARCRISIASPGAMFPGSTDERALIATGPPDGIRSAIASVLEMTEDDPSNPMLHIVLPSHAVQELLSHGTQALKQIGLTTHTQIGILPPLAGFGERVIRVQRFSRTPEAPVVCCANGALQILVLCADEVEGFQFNGTLEYGDVKLPTAGVHAAGVGVAGATASAVAATGVFARGLSEAAAHALSQKYRLSILETAFIPLAQLIAQKKMEAAVLAEQARAIPGTMLDASGMVVMMPGMGHGPLTSLGVPTDSSTGVPVGAGLPSLPNTRLPESVTARAPSIRQIVENASQVAQANSGVLVIQCVAKVPRVAQRHASAVIGLKGANVKDIQDSTGAKVKVTDSADTVTKEDGGLATKGTVLKEISISGAVHQVHAALTAMCEIMLSVDLRAAGLSDGRVQNRVTDWIRQSSNQPNNMPPVPPPAAQSFNDAYDESAPYDVAVPTMHGRPGAGRYDSR